MFICDHNNKRVQRWLKNDTHGQTIIANISCWGLAMDKEGSLHVSDNEHRVTKWPSSQIVAGGHGQGPALNQLGQPVHLFVDEHKSVFVADALHNRVMQWPLGAKEGILVAGANEVDSTVDYLNSRHRIIQPTAVIVDHMGTIYVADYNNHRIVRWFNGSTSGHVIMAEQGVGIGIPQVPYPYDLAFDRQGNLYVTELLNSRIRMFPIDKISCVKHSVELVQNSFLL
ncbi:unnamed protein product [Rotaria magnacalcarata]|uniref:NHL repeat-containing protein n=3 Tax=Rotaria magnacalcarata TaxID=392030 RepID=A0A8S2QJC9_9BILA|nr:unnamed protein product [Rotaria magnacalcarata]